ncbi:unnamed protein product [Urochloa humidicola]
MRIFYRVRLCLDGIPPHAWTPDIVERVIGQSCALQCINTDLIQPRDSRHIDLWAWTADPSKIPKKVWLFFTGGQAEHSSAVFISERPPEFWQLGVRFEVFLHKPVIEDYSAVENNLQAAVSNPASVVPVRRFYDWRYGLEDGAPPGARPVFPARLPLLPREVTRSGRADARGDGHDGRHDGTNGRRDNDDGRRGRGDTRTSHGSRDSHDTRAGHGKEQGGRSHTRSMSSRNSCKGMGFQWPRRREDDDDDFDHPGRERESPAAYGFFSLEDEEPIRRERTRSPRRREGGFWRRRGRNDDHPKEAWRPHKDDDDNLPAGRVSLHRGIADGEIGGLGAPELQMTSPVHDQSYTMMAWRFAERLGLARNAAWSETVVEDDVPARHAFSRLKSALSTPSMKDVELALEALQLAAAADQGAPLLAGGDGSLGAEAVPDQALVMDQEGEFVMGLEDAALLGLDGGAGCAGPFNGPAQADLAGTTNGPLGQEDEFNIGLEDAALLGLDGGAGCAGAFSGLAQAGLAGTNTGSLEPDGPDASLPAQHRDATAAAIIDDGDAPPAVDDLFTEPASPLLHYPPIRAPRRRRVFDMSAVRRSARLAAKPAMPSLQRAQNNLMRKLGLQVDERTPIEEVLREYVKSITGPLPDYIIAALATLLDLDDDGKDMMTEALLQHAGEGVAELQEEQEALMLRDD